MLRIVPSIRLSYDLGLVTKIGAGLLCSAMSGGLARGVSNLRISERCYHYDTTEQSKSHRKPKKFFPLNANYRLLLNSERSVEDLLQTTAEPMEDELANLYEGRTRYLMSHITELFIALTQRLTIKASLNKGNLALKSVARST
uniref:Uncharacterized protein n=1 Tax=Romanomermis culicivorax TaxID=13658 RepID=A0A915K0L9_ROMCU